MTTSKRIANRNNSIIISRREYEVLLGLKKLETFHPTAIQKKALVKAEANLLKDTTLTYGELAKKLGFTN